MAFTSNNALKTIKSDWPGTPVGQDGRFVNVEYPYIPGYRTLIKFLFTRNPQRKEKKEDLFQLHNANDDSFLNTDTDCIVWLGHATFFIRLGGKSLLVDPVFYKVPVTKRYSEHAFSPAAFKDLDYLLISHNHYDHCQEQSISEVIANNPAVSVLTGLGMDKLLTPWINQRPLQMSGWYQRYNTAPGIEIFYLPSRHWSRRTAFDTNKTLWGSFVIKSGGKCIYLSGDSGYGSHFKEAAKLFPNIDVAMIGVGAYKPDWFMSPIHVSPQLAVDAFHDLKAKTFIPMHYGTFDLSFEPPGEPVRILKEMDKAGEIHGDLNLLDLGDPYTGF